jgi:hypothetical protein
MKQTKRIIQHGLTAFLLVNSIASAWAQDASGPGIPMSAVRDSDAPADEGERERGKGFYSKGYHFLPSITASTFFNSNVFRTSSADSPQTVTELTSSMVGKFSAQISSKREGEPTQNKLSFSAGLGYTQFISNDFNVRNLSGLDASLGLSYLSQPKGSRSFVFSDSYQRTILPRTIRAGDQLLPTFNENSNRLVVGTRLRPKGGALEQQITYTGQLNFFEGAEFRTANHWEHSVGTYTKWNFLPRTAALFSFGLGYNDFFRDATRDPLGNLDSVPLRATIGALGVIGSRIQFSANIGYGNSFHRAVGALAGTSRDVSFSGVIGQLGGSINLADRTALNAVYSHNFESSLFGNFITRDELSVSLVHAFTPRLQTTGTFRTSIDRYSDIPPLDGLEATNPVARVDVPLQAAIDATYLARKDLRVGLFGSTLLNLSNFSARDLSNGGINDAGFFQAQLGVQATYAY